MGFIDRLLGETFGITHTLGTLYLRIGRIAKSILTEMLTPSESEHDRSLANEIISLRIDIGWTIRAFVRMDRDANTNSEDTDYSCLSHWIKDKDKVTRRDCLNLIKNPKFIDAFKNHVMGVIGNRFESMEDITTCLCTILCNPPEDFNQWFNSYIKNTDVMTPGASEYKEALLDFADNGNELLSVLRKTGESLYEIPRDTVRRQLKGVNSASLSTKFENIYNGMASLNFPAFRKASE